MSTLTPMMAQYRKIKDEYPDCVLMFRLGDFYEMFFEDALEASKILQITLTARAKGENKTPMCGVPYHAIDNYLYKLTRAGKKVAICDQMTEPNGKTIVEREVTRVVTPGTTFDENIIDQKANNYVAAITISKDCFGFAYADITTGEFKATEFQNWRDLIAEISRISPAECIASEEVLEKMKPLLSQMLSQKQSPYFFPFSYFKSALEELQKHFQINSLQIFGLETHDLAISSSGMLLQYLKETQKTDLAHIQKIRYYEVSEFMPLHEAVIRNLEIFYTSRDFKKEGSLNSVLDQTMTPMGGRMLRKWLLNPLLDQEKIEDRLNKVEIFHQDSSLLRELRDKLQNIFDVERLLSRLSLGTGNARDLKAIQYCLEQIPLIKNLISEQVLLKSLNDDLLPLTELRDLIDRAISEEAPLITREGGMIKSGFNAELDELRAISTEGKTFIKNLQEREIARTGISSLKVKFNKVFGYYIEISNANLSAVPEDFMRKQTLVNAERFITPELKEYEEKVLNAEEKIKDLEYNLFYQVRMEVVKEIVALQKLAGALATLDCLSNFAFVAAKNNYCKPQISNDVNLEITSGRHPVVEGISGRDFVPNDCCFDNSRQFLLITGPNMGGKSTFLRQVALICLMAQIGSFVPAKSAKLPVLDRIFTRVGASDNLIKGESTFMVEMQEAAYILNNATEKSLIILDEIGRGTSTYDGVSIAWALMEFLHDEIKAKTLFATHYHELIDLAEKLPNAANLSALVRENENEGVVFLYKIVEGGVDKSYGIEVAKLAGLPTEVVSRARGVLKELEEKQIKRKPLNKDQLALFEEQKRTHEGIISKEKNLINELNTIDINNLTPLEAITKLHEMKKFSSEKAQEKAQKKAQDI